MDKFLERRKLLLKHIQGGIDNMNSRVSIRQI